MGSAVAIGLLGNRRNAQRTGAGILLIVLSLSLPAEAQATDDKWHYTLAPYLMAASMGGTTGVRGFEADVDMSASDIFSNLEMGFNGYFGAQKGDWGFGVDIIYMSLGASTDYADIDPSQAAFTFLGTHRLAPTLDLTFGARWNVIRSRIEFKSTSPVSPGTTVEDTYQWVDPVIGIAWRQPIGERWLFGLPANVGGFGISSRFAVDFFPNIQYRVSKQTWLGAGWRVLYVDYETGYDDGPPALNADAFLYDVTSTGPVVGMLFRF